MSNFLDVQDVRKYFPIKGGIFRRKVNHVKAVDGISFSLQRGKTFGLVGESGCGKSTLGRSIIRLIEPTSGSVMLDGENITELSKAELFSRRKNMQIIFQDPYASLSPRRTIGQTLSEPLETHGVCSGSEKNTRVSELLETVGLRDNIVNRYPHEFSGGQRQRIGIARALALSPKLIVADEAVSALDVSVQSQVLNLLKQLQSELDLSFVFISHDLAVVQHISDNVGVMYLGKLVESAPSDTLFSKPLHPYTQALMSAAPIPDPNSAGARTVLEGEVPSPISPPPGCPFHTRCSQATEKCKTVEPLQTNMGDNDNPHLVQCHLYG